MDNAKILWADDEIDLLKPHILFLEERGYKVVTATNGDDALDLVEEDHFDIVFLDENMPGLSGLDTLTRIKSSHASLPVIMITKSEEESIMDNAIGYNISDYLIKPVNPKQILLILKKNLENKRLVDETSSTDYQQEFRQIGMKLGQNLSTQEWMDIYEKLVNWELRLQDSQDESMHQILAMQKKEANSQFFRFISSNYIDWMNDMGDVPLLSHRLFEEKVIPQLDQGPLFFVVIDNLRLDQWKEIRPMITDYFRVEEEEAYLSILPTATQYARNAIFSGQLPLEMEKNHPDLWRNDEDEGGKNVFEEDFLRRQMKRLGLKEKISYNKITNLAAGKKLADNFTNLLNNKLNVIVYNFVDMLSHARTEMEVIRELASDEKAYRSLTRSWFEHSALFDIMKQISKHKCRIILTTDHGTVHVGEPSKVIGDRNTNSNLRYKKGKNLSYEERDVFAVRKPEEAHLPQNHMTTSYVFAKEDCYFVYPNNYNHYVNYFRGTFQHGGISMEEMIIPLVQLSPK